MIKDLKYELTSLTKSFNKFKEHGKAKVAYTKAVEKARIPYDEWKLLHGKKDVVEKSKKDTLMKNWVPKDKYLKLVAALK